jgi:hypothetical protein
MWRLFHLNLNVGHSGRDLTIYDKIRWGGWALPDFVLADDLDSAGVISKTSHEWGLFVLSIRKHLSLLRQVHISCRSLFGGSCIVIGALLRRVVGWLVRGLVMLMVVIVVMVDTSSVGCLAWDYAPRIWTVRVVTLVGLGHIVSHCRVWVLVYWGTILVKSRGTRLSHVVLGVRYHSRIVIWVLVYVSLVIVVRTVMRLLKLLLARLGTADTVWNFLNCEMLLWLVVHIWTVNLSLIGRKVIA